MTVYPFINICYMVIYKLNHPFFEQYKDNDIPWPWESEPVKFRKKLKKAIKLIGFNNLFVGGAYSIFLIYGLGTKLKYTLEDIPSL